MTMALVILEWVMIGVGAGSVLLGMVFGVIDTTLRFLRWLQRIAESASERP